MKRGITETVAELIISKEEGLTQYLRRHEETLQSIECTDEKLGSIIQEFELPLLLEIIKGKEDIEGNEDTEDLEKYFDQLFPEFAHLSREAWDNLADKLQTHARECEHCGLKVYYDSEWACKVDSMVSQNLEEIIHISQDPVASDEAILPEEAADATH